MSILGNRVLRTEDPKFLTAGGDYVGDVALPPGATSLVYVRSTMAHARIQSIDVADAKAGPGVVDVVTADDLDIDPMPPSMGMLNQAMPQPYLAQDIVRYVGEPIAAVVAETYAQALDAAELVFVDLDPLDAVVESGESADSDVVLFADAGTNVAFDMPSRDSISLDDCEVVVRQRMVNQRVAAGPIEPRVAAAYWADDGRLVHYASCQGAHPVRDAICAGLGLETDQVRVIPPTWAAASAPRAAAIPRRSSSAGWPAGWGGPCDGSRPAPRTWSAWATAAPRSKTSRSAAPATAPSPATG